MYDKLKFSKAYIDDAQHYIFLAETSLNKNKYNLVIRECQTGCELSLKVVLFKLGRIVPKTHNLRVELKEVKELFSKDFQEEFDFIYKASNRLYSEREQSLYGDPDLNLTPQESYSREDAQKYLENTKKIFQLCKQEIFLQ